MEKFSYYRRAAGRKYLIRGTIHGKKLDLGSGKCAEVDTLDVGIMEQVSY